MGKIINLVIFTFLLSASIHAQAAFNSDTNYAQVEYVRLEEGNPGYWKITVTVRHNDQGWGHYADYWKVTDRDTGQLLGERILYHPHDNEQPFSRSASGIFIDKIVRYIEISARCNQHGFEGRRIIVDLEKDDDEIYSIKR